mgnify:CR=1 FL=1
MIEKRITDAESHSKGSYVSIGHKVLQAKAKALTATAKNLGRNFHDAVDCILECKGRLVVIGVGKSGHIARKIASTMTSTGSPAFFIHPTEASHGDLGLLKKNDILIMLSNSGKSKELLDILNFTNKQKIPSILVSSNPESKLSKLSTYNILIPKLDDMFRV